MKRAAVNGVDLEYEMSGNGEPVVCIHGAYIADTFTPLVAESCLADRYALLTYRRRGYVGSTRGPEPISIPLEAADCRALLDHLGIQRAHVVGHSYGGCIAIQLALDAPDLVHTLALLEPALMVGDSAEQYREAMVRNERRYREAGAAVAIDEALKARCPTYQALLDDKLPGAFDQAVADAETTYAATPGFLAWKFGEAEARRVHQPVLCVLGEQSEALWPRFGETQRLLLSWLPRAEGYILPGATHFLQLEDPPTMADALAAFFTHHPMPA